MPSRIIIVANRLPVTIDKSKEGPDALKKSSGGLVQAFNQVAKASREKYEEIVYIGWPGADVPDIATQIMFEELLKNESTDGITVVPVWLSEAEVKEFYNGYSNSSLWPLLHWMTTYAEFSRSWAESYRTVNLKFAEKIYEVSRPEDLIWVQDYHLFLVPQYLRRMYGHKATRFSSFSEQGKTLDEMRPKDLPLDTSEVHLEPQKELSAKRPDDLDLAKEPGAKFQDAVEDAGAIAMGHAATEYFPAEDSTSLAKVRKDSCGPAGSALQAQREEVNVKIAFFLHTPFPSYEVFCLLPQCAELLEGLLGADLVGFHTYGYLRHFRSCVVRLCGLNPEIDHIDHMGHRTRLGVFPIGANCQAFQKAMGEEEFHKHFQAYTEQFKDKNLVLSVERLDYSKGLPQKLAAIEKYLQTAENEKQDKEKKAKEKKEKGPAVEDGEDEAKPEEDASKQKSKLKEMVEDRVQRNAEESLLNSKYSTRLLRWGSNITSLIQQAVVPSAKEVPAPVDHTKTVFLFITVPTREEVEAYKNIEENVQKSVSRINGQFSTVGHQPLVYLHRTIPLQELTALYARADCCFVTPLIDGMNLVAKEFIVCKDKEKNVMPGCLVLSEQAGAAQELFDAIVVNPYDEDAVANALEVGIELAKGLDEAQRWQLSEPMRQAIIKNDCVRWAETLLDELQKPLKTRLPRHANDPIIKALPDEIACRFYAKKEGTKALFLDYDGTLREFEDDKEMALPGQELAVVLKSLDAREDLEVYIVSGRDQDFLETNFKDYKSFTLVAEHGYSKRGPDTGYKWEAFNDEFHHDWIQQLQPIMKFWEDSTPGSKVESKKSSIVWHWRNCDPEYGAIKAKELMFQLSLSLGNLPCCLSTGNKIIEVASLQVKKGPAVLSACKLREAQRKPFVEVICIGDDRTDESMFLDAQTYKEDAITVKVGEGDTHASFRLQSPAEVRRFLQLVGDQAVPEEESQVVAPEGAQEEKPQAKESKARKLDVALRGETGRFATARESELPGGAKGGEEDDDEGPLDDRRMDDVFKGLAESENVE